MEERHLSGLSSGIEEGCPAFARSLRHVLSVTNMTNKEFADLVKTDEGTVSRWVNGKQRPGRRRIAVVEQLLGVEPGTLQSDGAQTGSEVTPGQQQKPELPTRDDAPNGASQAEAQEDPGKVILEFNRWIEPYIANGGFLRAVDAVEWMQRMWRAGASHPPDPIHLEPAQYADPDIPLDIDVEPGTGIAITTSKGRMVVVNHALSEMLGRSQADLIGRYVWEVNAPEFAQPGQNRIMEQLTEPWDLELITGSAERIPVTISNIHCHLRGHPVRVALVKQRGDRHVG